MQLIRNIFQQLKELFLLEQGMGRLWNGLEGNRISNLLCMLAKCRGTKNNNKFVPALIPSSGMIKNARVFMVIRDAIQIGGLYETLRTLLVVSLCALVTFNIIGNNSRPVVFLTMLKNNGL